MPFNSLFTYMAIVPCPGGFFNTGVLKCPQWEGSAAPQLGCANSHGLLVAPVCVPSPTFSHATLVCGIVCAVVVLRNITSTCCFSREPVHCRTPDGRHGPSSLACRPSLWSRMVQTPRAPFTVLPAVPLELTVKTQVLGPHPRVLRTRTSGPWGRGAVCVTSSPGDLCILESFRNTPSDFVVQCVLLRASPVNA